MAPKDTNTQFISAYARQLTGNNIDVHIPWLDTGLLHVNRNVTSLKKVILQLVRQSNKQKILDIIFCSVIDKSKVLSNIFR